MEEQELVPVQSSEEPNVPEDPYVYQEAPPVTRWNTPTTTHIKVKTLLIVLSVLILFVICYEEFFTETMIFEQDSNEQPGISQQAVRDGTSPTTQKNIGSESYKKLEQDTTQNPHPCQKICQARRDVRIEQFGGDLLSSKDMLRLAATAKGRLLSKLKVDYGQEYFAKIFEREDARDESSARQQLYSKILGNLKSKSKPNHNLPYQGVQPISKDGPSLERLKTKLYIKLLSVQTAIRKQEENIDGCDCTHGDTPIAEDDDSFISQGNSTQQQQQMNLPESFYSRFVWATGGHSSAAGHGNLYNETYTAFLESAVKDVFASVGIDFEARNRAIGGISSGYEVSMCSEAIFGNDIDVLSWDYAMTDGRKSNKLSHFGYRAGLNPGRPALVAMHLGSKPSETARRLAALEELEAMGLSVFWASADIAAKMESEIPDTEGFDEAQIKELPDYVRNFKCGDSLEKGLPHCSEEKFNLALCPHRAGKTSWHPGVKAHALDGNKFALFLVQVLLDSLNDLADGNSLRDIDSIEDSKGTAEAILGELTASEDARFQSFAEASMPEHATNNFEADSEIDVDLIFKAPNVCHTGLLPAQTRYLGILTDTDKVGSAASVGEETYDVGITKEEADQSDAYGSLRLVYDPSARHNCPVPLRVDYRDYFYASATDDWVSLTIPNHSEREAYRYDPGVFQGMIVIFFVVCERGKCMNGEIHGDKVEEGKFEMEVNGEVVTAFAPIGDDGRNSGYAVKGKHGLYWKPKASGAYEIKIRVTEPASFVRISSFVLY